MAVSNKNTKIAALSVASNSALVALKLAAGIFTGSISIISEAAHSSIDLLAALMAYFSVRSSGKPADDSHPYGHGKIENISGTIEALLIFVAAVFIIWESVKKLIHPAKMEKLEIAIGVMLFSSLVNIVVSKKLFKAAAESESVALKADAEHLRVDVFTSAGVFAALLLIHFTGWHALDPIIAIVVAIFIFGIAIKLTCEAGAPLLDAQLPPKEVEQVEKIICSHPKVVGYHKLRTRKSGAERHIDVHLLVDKNLPISDAHHVAEEVEDQIRGNFKGSRVITHVEPDDDEVIEDRADCVDKGNKPGN